MRVEEMKSLNDLDPLIDLVVEDIIASSEGTFLAEVAEDCGDVNALATGFDQITSRLISDFESQSIQASATNDPVSLVRQNEGGFVGVQLSELIRFLTSQDYDLSSSQRQSLFRYAELKDKFRALKDELCSLQFLPVATASTGAVRERYFKGGNLRLTPSSMQGQVYLSIQLDDPFAATSQLFVETAEGLVHKLNLPAPDSEGKIFIVLDLGNEREAFVIEALRDPVASGAIVQTIAK